MIHRSERLGKVHAAISEGTRDLNVPFWLQVLSVVFLELGWGYRQMLDISE